MQLTQKNNDWCAENRNRKYCNSYSIQENHSCSLFHVNDFQTINNLEGSLTSTFVPFNQEFYTFSLLHLGLLNFGLFNTQLLGLLLKKETSTAFLNNFVNFWALA